MGKSCYENIVDIPFQLNNAKLFKQEQLEEVHAKQLESLKMVHDQEKAQLLDEFESKVNEFNNEGNFFVKNEHVVKKEAQDSKLT